MVLRSTNCIEMTHQRAAPDRGTNCIELTHQRAAPVRATNCIKLTHQRAAPVRVTNCIELTHQSPEGGTGPGDELYRTDSLEGGTEPGDELFRTDSPEGSTGTGDELYRLDTSAVDVLYLGADYLHHVAVREEVAGEVEADGQRLSGRRFLEPHDRPLHLTLADAERLHSVDVRRNFAATDQSVLTTR